MKTMLLCVACLCAGVGYSWDVEHDEIAQLTGEFLPAEIKSQLTFGDFAILMSNCHFPDMLEWPSEGGKRRNHTLDELGQAVGPVDKEIFRQHGYKADGDWMHREHARALVLGLLARAFANGEHAKAAFYISVMTHQVADESALNHPPMLQFAQYSRFPGIDLGLRKVEGGAKNVFGFRSDGYTVFRARQKLAGYVPKAPTDEFASSVFELVADAVRQADVAARQEGLIGFGDMPKAQEALAELVTMQIRVLENMVWTAWRFRSPTAALPDPGFEERCVAYQLEIRKSIDPSRQAVFAGIFDPSLDPKDPKAVVGIVCEPYGMFSSSATPYMGRMIGASCGRTLRKNGYGVRGLSYYAVEKDGLPDPKAVPVVLLCTGGTGYKCTDVSDRMAAHVITYREKGGKLVLVGGADKKNLSGFAETMRVRPNADIPVTAAWHDLEAADALKMSLVGADSLRCLGGTRTRFARSPNIDGFSKAVCPIEVLPAAGIRPILFLDNGRETFLVGVRKGNVVWLPMYALAQYLLVADDPHLDFNNLTLDPYGEKVLMDAMEGLCLGHAPPKG